jgi:hypothetical protein
MKTYQFYKILLLLFFSQSVFAQVVINEYSASNFSSFPNSLGIYSDWIELYNTGNNEVNLNGYYLSEDENNPKKFKINDDLIIMPKSYVRIYANGRNITLKDSIGNLEVHTNFNITQSKQNQDILILLNRMGKVADYTKVRKTQLGQSVGRFPDGSKTWKIFENGTPGSGNSGKNFSKFAETPTFSLNSGFFDKNLRVTIGSKQKNVKLYYTLDGSEPTLKSKIYDTPIDIDKTTVLKAMAVSNDRSVYPSFLNYATYFINEQTPLMVVSISGTDSLLALANGNKALRPFGSVEIFLEKKLVASAYGEFNKHGEDSWRNNQRALDFECVDGMGYANELRSKLFKLSERDRFQKVMFRPSGDDNYPDGSGTKGGGAHLRDAFIQNLVKKSDMQLDVRSGEKMILYINGNYWGVYDLREKVNDRDYTDYYYGQDRKDVQMLMTWAVTETKFDKPEVLDYWEDVRLFVNEHDLSIPENYQIIEEQVDLISFADYIIANTATVTTDWINYNTAWWRGLNMAGNNKKWKYTLWDNDATFGYYINYTGLPDTSPNAKPCDIYEVIPQRLQTISVEELKKSEGLTFEDIVSLSELGFIKLNADSTLVTFEIPSADINGHILMLKKLMENKKFRDLFLKRYTDLINRTFNKDSMLAYLNEQYMLIKPEMPRHIKRWGGTMEEWEKNVQDLRDFITKRDPGLKNGLKTCYNLQGPFKLAISSDQNNLVNLKVNSLDINKLPYSGIYFGGLENQIEAIFSDSSKYQFKGWESDKNSQLLQPLNSKTSLKINGDTQIEMLTSKTLEEKTEPIRLMVPFPNTFHDKLNAILELEVPTNVSIDLLDRNGNQISTLIASKHYSSGKHIIEFESLNGLNPGQYFLRVVSSNFKKSTRIIKI